jgi:hypothetical protein
MEILGQFSAEINMRCGLRSLSREASAMPEIIETVVYHQDELRPDVRETARDWYRQRALAPDWFECVCEDFE